MAGYGWQKLFRAYCGYNGCILDHFQSIVMPLGRVWGSLQGLEFPMWQWNNVISCFSRFWRCCGVFEGCVWLTKVGPSILRVQWVHIRALSVDIDASGSFLGSLKGRAIAISLCDVKQRDFLVFHDVDDVVVFSRAGYGWQKLFRAYCGYNGCTLRHL